MLSAKQQWADRECCFQAFGHEKNLFCPFQSYIPKPLEHRAAHYPQKPYQELPVLNLSRAHLPNSPTRLSRAWATQTLGPTVSFLAFPSFLAPFGPGNMGSGQSSSILIGKSPEMQPPEPPLGPPRHCQGSVPTQAKAQNCQWPKQGTGCQHFWCSSKPTCKRQLKKLSLPSTTEHYQREKYSREWGNIVKKRHGVSVGIYVFLSLLSLFFATTAYGLRAQALEPAAWVQILVLLLTESLWASKLPSPGPIFFICKIEIIILGPIILLGICVI